MWFASALPKRRSRRGRLQTNTATGEGKIKARDACPAPSGAKVLSARWVTTAFTWTESARHEARLTEERKYFIAVVRGVVVRA
jgi:hypothetical protein